MKKQNETKEIKQENILIKLCWIKQLEFLSMEERGIVFTNIYNYHLGKDLEEMTIPATMFFTNAVEVFEYNTEKYKNKVERNRVVGKLGGRPKLNNQMDIEEIQNNPMGFIQNPENPKDKGIDKNIDKGIDIEKDIDKTRDIVIDKDKITGFEKIVISDINSYSDPEDRQVISNIKILVKKIGFDQFINLVLGTSFNELPDLISSLNLAEYEPAIREIRKNHVFYLHKFSGN